VWFLVYSSRDRLPYKANVEAAIRTVGHKSPIFTYFGYWDFFIFAVVKSSRDWIGCCPKRWANSRCSRNFWPEFQSNISPGSRVLRAKKSKARLYVLFMGLGIGICGACKSTTSYTQSCIYPCELKRTYGAKVPPGK